MVSLLLGVLVVTLSGIVTVGGFQYLKTIAPQSASVELGESISKFRLLREGIGNDNALIEAAHTLDKDRIIWSEFMNDLFDAMPQGVTIQEISADAKTGHLTFSGQADSRNTLVVLEKNLSGIPWVASVRAPHTNLIQRTHSEYFFDMTIKGYGEDEVKEPVKEEAVPIEEEHP